MELHLETKVRRPGSPVLRERRFVRPGTAIFHAIVAEHKRAYRHGRLDYLYTAPWAWRPGKCRWAVNPGDPGEEKSLVPCITAVAIEIMKLGLNGRRYKRTDPKKGDA